MAAEGTEAAVMAAVGSNRMHACIPARRLTARVDGLLAYDLRDGTRAIHRVRL